MLRSLTTGLGALVIYLILTMESGSLGLWSLEELIVGAVLALGVGLIAGRVLGKGEADYKKLLNPRRWALFLVYLVGPFFFAMFRANLDVAYRVITGRIKPGIIKISPGLKSDLAASLLGNSITLTPGTLTVDIDKENNFYIHWINVRNPQPSPEEVCGRFPRWARRIAE
ncbi:MAG: Na+/H+ antiporter subunit E [Candidatus Acetothermia bacterium]|nr:Na+/H+ antiporter subunit E [Candidatus Acetothermia bacterium]MDH7505639.1 Na+/H+ antiporter subunit E [Candidatus Acetothermia bacterium]